MKEFVQIVVQEKSLGDYRAFCAADDSRGERWELRGYGRTPGEAAANVYERFQRPEDEWDVYGYVIVPSSPARRLGTAPSSC